MGYGPPQIINWNADIDAQALQRAMKGFGTNEQLLIDVLHMKDPLQVEALKPAFFRLDGRKTLEGAIRDETGSWFQKGLVAIVQGPLLHDCHLLYDAMKGLGTNEKVLNDVLLSRSNADMQAIKGKFQQVFSVSLESMVKDDLSMKTERHFLIVLGATRAEDSAPLIPQEIDRDVDAIYDATEGMVGTDEMKVCSILSTRNDNQIRAIAHTYERKYKRRLEDVIRKVGGVGISYFYVLHAHRRANTPTLGVQWPHGRCASVPAPSRLGQVHARGGASGRLDGWSGDERPPSREQGDTVPLGPRDDGEREGRLQAEVQGKPLQAHQGRDQRGLPKADARLCRRMRRGGSSCVIVIPRGYNIWCKWEASWRQISLVFMIKRFHHGHGLCFASTYIEHMLKK